jgi:imidazolonepropionase-like amidohydrolase
MEERKMKKHRSTFLIGCVLLLIVLAWSLDGANGEAFLIKGAKIYTSSARGVLKDVALLVEDGKIREIIQGENLPSLPVKDYSGKCIMPGMVDAHTYVSGYYRLLENTEVITSDLVAFAVFDPFHPEVKSALQSGITTVNLVPRNENLVGGISSIFKLIPSQEHLSFLRRSGFLKISFNSEVRNPDRAPTSLMGAEDILSEKMKTIKTDQQKNREEIFQQKGILALLNGDLAPMIAASEVAEINTTIEWLKKWNMKGVIVGGEEAHLLVNPLKERDIPVLHSPLLPSYPEKIARNAALLVKQGIKIAFVSYMPEVEPWSLRLSALLLYHQGISPEEALMTITLNPAQILGIEDAVGSIEKDKDADLVVLTGEPLDLSSQIIAVYVNGRPVFEEMK